ncbi:MAG: hypothetical protein M1276_08415 [Deltaproteobacteria bacterium]|nr:hypothetical protein [Deltaproteobacteria bacterium]
MYRLKRIAGSNRGISIVLAIIIIIVLGLAGSIFEHLTSSGNITSRSNLTSVAAKYAAESGVEITMYEILPPGGAFGNSNTGQFSGCPTKPVPPPGVSGVNPPYLYLYGDLKGKPPNPLLSSSNYTPTFCAVYGTLSGGGGGNCTYYVITSNGFAGGTEREITAEVGIKKGGKCTGIYVETELPNSYNH